MLCILLMGIDIKERMNGVHKYDEFCFDSVKNGVL